MQSSKIVYSVTKLESKFDTEWKIPNVNEREREEPRVDRILILTE